MSVADLTFINLSTSETIYNPLTLTTSVTQQVRITNYGTENLTNLGAYVETAYTVGDVDYPADYPPETDYQDLMTWGQAVKAGLAVAGGLKLTLPQNDLSSPVEYVTRDQGAKRENKLPLQDIASGTFVDITLELETPPAVLARRLYVTLVVE